MQAMFVALDSQCVRLTLLPGTVWNILVDATSPSLTKACKSVLKESLQNFMSFKTVSDPTTSAGVFVSVTSLLPGGVTVL
jgi:hypothetical protein